jgi:hypothetical protein
MHSSSPGQQGGQGLRRSALLRLAPRITTLCALLRKLDGPRVFSTRFKLCKVHACLRGCCSVGPVAARVRVCVWLATGAAPCIPCMLSLGSLGSSEGGKPHSKLHFGGVVQVVLHLQLQSTRLLAARKLSTASKAARSHQEQVDLLQDGPKCLHKACHLLFTLCC